MLRYFKLLTTGFVAALGLTCISTSVAAQALTAEEISRMLDEQAATPNPYAALLNDPDPQRSMGAMKIMMESGDPQLISLAKEFGLLSSNPRVQKEALGYYLATRPNLAVQFDLSKEDGVSSSFLNAFRATENLQQQAFTTWRIGEYDNKQQCFVWDGDDDCMFKINANGVFIEGSHIKAQLSITPEGALLGVARLGWIDNPSPMQITLLE